MKFKTILILLISIFSTHAFATFVPVAKISKIQGSAFINRHKAAVGDEIVEGQEVRVQHGKDFVEIKYTSGHMVRLRGGIMKVVALDPKNSNIELIKGTIFNFIQKLTKEERFNIQTRRASFAVRGTKFYLQEDKKQSYLCVCEGTVVANNKKVEILVNKDQDLFVNATKPFKTTASSQMMRDMGNEVFKSMK